MRTLPSQRNYQLRQNGAVDITLFKRCITSICNTYLYGHIAQPKQSTPVKISRSQQLRIHDGKYQVGHNVPTDNSARHGRDPFLGERFRGGSHI